MTPWNPNEPAEVPEWLRASVPSPLKLPAVGSALNTYAPASPTPASVGAKDLPKRLEDLVATANRHLGAKPFRSGPVLNLAINLRGSVVPVFAKDSALVRSLDGFIKEGRANRIGLEQCAQMVASVENLVEGLKALSGFALGASVSRASVAPVTKDLFVIHGHDELNTRRLTDLLKENLSLRPIVMLAKPGIGRTLPEKFEDEAQTCSFALALFTPDDEVRSSTKLYCQARPNVIYETGWFVGRLGKRRVVLLLKKGTQLHSDLDGISRIEFREDVADKFLEIQKELKAARVIP